MPDPVWLTAKAAAARLAVTVDTVLRYAAEGKLNGYSLAGGRHLRFKSTDVDALMQPVTR